MSERERAPKGATTAGRGTAMPVDLTGDRAAWRTAAVLLAGPMIWTLHFLVVYLVAEAGCSDGGRLLRSLRPPVPAIVTIVATVVAVVACLVAARWGARRWRRDRGDGEGKPDPGGSLALAGSLLSLLGVAVVLFVGVPALVLPTC